MRFQLPAAYKTYQILAPAATHWRAATCAEVDCGAYLSGWATVIDESVPDPGQKQAYYIRYQSERRFTESRNAAGLTVFVFEAGQDCFRRPHRTPVGRPEFFVVRDGAHRRDLRPADWVDDFANHQQRLADAQAKG
jgi:hypothetical protein